MSRIEAAFDRLRVKGEAALIPYLMTGYPSMAATRELLYALVRAGADLVELGIPFSDPLADGATLQRAGYRALRAGASPRGALDLVASVRAEVDVPIVLMSYYNPVLRMGDERFASAAGAAGVDGIIVPDLPVEESAALGDSCRAAGVDLVGMVAPTSPDHRVVLTCNRASGFVYCVSLKGVTGARGALPRDAEALVGRVKRATRLPAVVGFGISTPEQVSAITSFADGAVVASALTDEIDRESHRATDAAGEFVAALKAACRKRIKMLT